MEWRETINLEVSQRKRKLRKYQDIKIVQEPTPPSQCFSGSLTFLPKEPKLFFNDKNSTVNDDRPFFAFPDGHIFLETFSSHHEIAKNFLDAIAIPVSLSEQIQEYQINTNSLLGAITNGISQENLIKYLHLLSKNQIDNNLIQLIAKTYESFSGFLILLNSKDEWLLYSNQKQKLEDLYLPLNFYSIQDKTDKNLQNFDNTDIIHARIFGPLAPSDIVCESNICRILFDQDPNEYFCFKLLKNRINDVKRKLEDNHIYYMNEYDFLHDSTIENIEINLKDHFQLLPYQYECVSKFFPNRYLRSGIISLPFGSGKSTLGCFIITQIKKPTIVFCENLLTINKWIHLFELFTTIRKEFIISFIPGYDSKLNPNGLHILLTTYSYFLSNNNINLICSKSWGLLIFDELSDSHLNSVLAINEKVKSQSKIGLAPFPISNDETIRKFNYAIGPQFYTKSWNDLSQNGFLPKVKCSIIYCKMTPPFLYGYTTSTSLLLRRLLSGLNPNKIMFLERLIKMHEGRNDKILVISDVQYILEKYAQLLFVDGQKRRPLVTLTTPVDDRERYFNRFIYQQDVSCLFLSRIIDKAIDIPPANVLIQITPYIGSKVSEVQRMAKLLKPKFGRTNTAFENSYFYIFVSEDTKEMFCSNKSRQNLVESGFLVKPVYKVMSHQAYSSKKKVKLTCQTAREQKELYDEIMKTSQNNGAFEILDEEKFMTAPSNLHLSKTLPSISMIGKKKELKKYKNIYEK